MATVCDLQSLLTDASYAQDALERLTERLEQLLAEAEAVDAEDAAGDGPSALEVEEMHALCDAWRADISEEDLPF